MSRVGLGLGLPVLRRPSSGGGSSSYVDDFVPLAEIRQIYGPRRLIRGYAGSAMRVRRSSDSAEQDIGFSGDEFDQAALTTFVGANNGTIVRWYDQTGAGAVYDLTQAALSAQPTIVAAGSFLGGFETDGVDDRLSTGSIPSVGTAALTVFMAARLYITGTGVAYGHLDVGPRHSSTNAFYLDYFPAVSGFRLVTAVGDHSPYELERNMVGLDPTGSVHTMTFVSDRNGGTSAAKHKAWIDGSISGSTHTGDSTYIGTSAVNGWYGKGLWRSLVICKNDHSAVRADVEALL
jgi:hypothetical protein